MPNPPLPLWIALLPALLLAGCRTGGARGPSFVPAASTGSAAGSEAAPTPSTPPRGAAAEAQGGPAEPAPRLASRGRAEIGKPAPELALRTIDGRLVRLSDFKDRIVVLEWFSPTCPWSVYAWDDKGPLRELTERLRSEGVVWLTINSEKPESPGGELDRNRLFWQRNQMRVPLLMDPTGLVGRTWQAKMTPHVFVVSPSGLVVYGGALDNAPLGKVRDEATKTNYVEEAIRDLRNGHAVTASETKPYGCPVHYSRP